MNHQEKINHLVLAMFTILTPEQKKNVLLESDLDQDELLSFLQIQDSVENIANLTIMTTSFKELRQTTKISNKLMNIFEAASLSHPWMLYAWKKIKNHSPFPASNEDIFVEAFTTFWSVGKNTKEELFTLMEILSLPELDTVEFTDKQIRLLESLTTN